MAGGSDFPVASVVERIHPTLPSHEEPPEWSLWACQRITPHFLCSRRIAKSGDQRLDLAIQPEQNVELFLDDRYGVLTCTAPVVRRARRACRCRRETPRWPLRGNRMNPVGRALGLPGPLRLPGRATDFAKRPSRQVAGLVLAARASRRPVVHFPPRISGPAGGSASCRIPAWRSANPPPRSPLLP